MTALTPGGVAQVIERLEAFLKGARCFPQLEQDRASIETLLQQVKAKQGSLETPLRVILLGGTGVGKSSLLNALAGEDVAKAAATRPTTRELTAYFHADTGSSSLGELESRAKLVPHHRAALKDKILVDAPDFDSTAHENRVLLEKALESTDLALVVVTPEKYMAHELFSILEKHRSGVAFVFVLNKCDRTTDAPAVAADLRRELERRGFREPRVLSVSAQAARAAQRALSGTDARASGPGEAPAEAGEWNALTNLLERELDRVRIREIKASKLQDRVRALLERIERAVPEDAPKRLEKWRLGWQAGLADLTADLGHQLFGALRNDFELRNVLAYLFGTSLGGVFGAFMTLVYGTRALLQPGFARARRLTGHELDELIGERLRAVDPASVERRVALAFERFEDEGRRHGFESHGVGTPDLERQGLPASVAALVAAVRSQAARRFYDVFEETLGNGKVGSVQNRFLWNVAPFAVIALSAFAFGQRIVQKLMGTGAFDMVLVFEQAPAFLQATIVAWLLVSLAQWPLAERAIQRKIVRSFELLEGVVARAVQECLGAALLSRPEKALEEVAARYGELDRLKKDARRVLGGDVVVAPPVRTTPATALPRTVRESPPADLAREPAGNLRRSSARRTTLE